VQFNLKLPRCVYIDGPDIFQFAERMDVTPDLEKRAIEHYHDRGLLQDYK